MKIIRQGTKPSLRIYRPTCYCCNTLFEFEQHEGKITHDQRDGDYISITCPVCGKTLVIDIQTYIRTRE